MIDHPTYLVVSVAAYVVLYAYLWIDGRRDRG